jgi:endonuclease/exonuclease/phosphatase (EEP) superfamily protein YafD
MLRKLALVGVIVVICAAGLVLFVSLPTGYPGPKDPAVPNVIRVAAANLYFRNTDPDAAAVLERLDADLLILLERTRHNLALDPLINAGWIAEFDEPSSQEGAHGTMILRRHSVSATASVMQLPLTRSCDIPMATVLTKIGGRSLCILGVHVPPRHACGESHTKTFKWLGGQIDDGHLVVDLGACGVGDPVVLAGDFNALPWSRPIRNLREAGLVDSYAAWRWRPAGTWTSKRWLPTVARIDYVLAPRDARAVGAWIVNLPGSDHRAVVADLRF